MSIEITVTDLFCGAGGSSIGAEKAGAVLRMAANHWRLAIDTHNTNFPNADHDCADVSQVNPRRYPRTDILIASPECTNHSQAKARKLEPTIWDPNPPGLDEQERSRATMWDVPRFAEHHRYEIVIVENVIEASRWLPFDAWLASMHALGYTHRIVSLNSFVAQPTPQSRDRMYVVFWRRGNRAPDLDFFADAWCPRCEVRVSAVQSWKNGRAVGRYRQQYVYRCPTCAELAIPFAYPAATAIDWALPTLRIGDRTRPLAEATLRRIRAGLERYGPSAIVAAAGNTWEKPGSGYARAWPVTIPIPVQAATAQHALVVETAYSGRSDGGRVRGTEDPLRTQTGQQSQALVLPMRGEQKAHRAADEPIGTQVASSSEHALVVPLRTHGKAAPADEATFPTFVAGNAGHALLVRNYGNPGGDPGRHVTPVSEVARTITADPGTALLMRNNGGGAEMSTPVEEVARTVTTKGHQSLVTLPFLTDYHGSGKPWQARGVDRPMGTVESVDRRGLVDPVAIEVDDCGFRMLEPHEIGAAMAFPESYVVHGNKRERVRQYGNAVTPPVMDGILRRCIESLAGEVLS
ncbi:MAG TPA: DNA cytosine methyltransferase [Candidatus Limnocylindrales bacterium]|nr:DNA cytosine methyltransferase [Candidatus Limnocylindrales bacterium]